MSIRLILIQYQLYIWSGINRMVRIAKPSDRRCFSFLHLTDASIVSGLSCGSRVEAGFEGTKARVLPIRGFEGTKDRVLPIRDTRHLWFLLLSSLESSHHHTFRKKESMAPLHLNFLKVSRELQYLLLHNQPTYYSAIEPLSYWHSKDSDLDKAFQ